MSGLVVASLQRCGVRHLTLANRTRERALGLAEPAGAQVVAISDLPAALAAADVVVSCTGAVGHVIPASLVSAAAAARAGRAEGPQVYVDLALPRDVEPAAAAVPGVIVLDLDVLGRDLGGRPGVTGVGSARGDLEQARAIVAQEVAAYLTARRAEAVAPTVVALRARARAVVESELARLDTRVASLDPVVRSELERTVHRVVEKLLHTPTVRVKQLADAPGGALYADALRELFDLDSAAAVADAAAGGPLPAVSQGGAA